MHTPHRQIVTGALVVCSVYLLAHTFYSRSGYSRYDDDRTRLGYPPYPPGHAPPPPNSAQNVSLAETPRPRRNVAVASAFGFHMDVYMAFAKTLGDVMDEDGAATEQTIHLFAPPFAFGFEEIVDDLNLWKHRGVRAQQEQLVDYVNQNTGDGGIDLLVFGTCEVDMRFWHEALMDAWSRRDDDHKFKIVCGVHNAADEPWQAHITWWSRRDAIRLVAIADHVAKTFKNKFAALADSPQPVLSSAGYEHIPVEVHVPLLDMPGLPSKPLPRSLAKAVIQGHLSEERRDYRRFFRDLIASLHEDPDAWGYNPLEDRKSFVPKHGGDSPAPPFQLLLVGSGNVDIPDELAYVVSLHGDLSYKDFYALVAGADVIVPAFTDFGYYDNQASSTIALAAELNVPLLVTQRIRETYGYVDNSSVVITRPAAMPEVQALKALRTGDAHAFLASDPADIERSMGEVPSVRDAVRKMMEEGWVRGRDEWVEWREGVWRKNREVARKVLWDLR